MVITADLSVNVQELNAILAVNVSLLFYLLRVDSNKDKSVSAKEMQRWIMEKTEEHFQEAMVENKNSFRGVDPDANGERENPLII